MHTRAQKHTHRRGRKRTLTCIHPRTQRRAYTDTYPHRTQTNARLQKQSHTDAQTQTSTLMCAKDVTHVHGKRTAHDVRHTSPPIKHHDAKNAQTGTPVDIMIVSAQRKFLQIDVNSGKATSYACNVPIPHAHAYMHARGRAPGQELNKQATERHEIKKPNEKHAQHTSSLKSLKHTYTSEV